MENTAPITSNEEPEPAQEYLHQTPFELLPWDVIENIFFFLEPAEIVNTACVNKVHYALAHGQLWRKPNLSLTQAMIFTRFIYRRPVVTNALPPSVGDVVQKERPQCVVCVNLHLEREIAGMLEIALESVVRRIMGFCPQATFEVHLNSKYQSAWSAMLADKEKPKIKLHLHLIEDKAEENAT